MIEKITNELIEVLDEQQIIGRGNNSKCFLIDDDSVVLVSNSSMNVNQTYDYLIERTKLLEAQGVNVGRIKDYRYKDGKLYVLQTRVKAKDLYSDIRRNTTETMKNFRTSYESLKILSNAPQEHFDKYVSDLIKIIYEHGLWIDHRHSDNLMYDKETGFYFIDLSVSNPNMLMEINMKISSSDILYLIIGNITDRSFFKIPTEEENNMLSVIYEKIFQALIKFSKQDDKKRIESNALMEILYRYPNIKSENIEKEVKDLHKIEHIQQLRKKMLKFVRINRIYNLSNIIKFDQLIIYAKAYDLFSIPGNLSFEDEKRKLEELDNLTLEYLETRSEVKEIALKEKCTEFGLIFEEHVQETIEANNKEGQEAVILKQIIYAVKSISKQIEEIEDDSKKLGPTSWF